MTIAELNRAINSYNRRKKAAAQERATMDYILADLIGRSVARVYNSANHMPEISEVYTTLFDAEEIKQQRQTKKAELSALRFKHFAEAYNERFNKGAAKVE